MQVGCFKSLAYWSYSQNKQMLLLVRSLCWAHCSCESELVSLLFLASSTKGSPSSSQEMVQLHWACWIFCLIISICWRYWGEGSPSPPNCLPGFSRSRLNLQSDQLGKECNYQPHACIHICVHIYTRLLPWAHCSNKATATGINGKEAWPLIAFQLLRMWNGNRWNTISIRLQTAACCT